MKKTSEAQSGRQPSDTQQRAHEIREGAVRQVLSRKALRNDSRLRGAAINTACRELVADNKKLSVGNVIRVLKDKHKPHALSESSIRNNTPSGRAYRDVIAAWSSYQIAIGQRQRHSRVDDDDGDIADSIIGSIKDERVRLRVLGLRTALRNAKRQLQMLQAISPAKLIYHSPDGKPVRSSRPGGKIDLTESERDALVAMLNPIEIATNGLSWTAVGQLQRDKGEFLSRPGLRQAIERALGVEPGHTVR